MALMAQNIKTQKAELKRGKGCYFKEVVF